MGIGQTNWYLSAIFRLQQVPKESLSVSVRPSVTSLTRALHLHLSGSNLQAISQECLVTPVGAMRVIQAQCLDDDT